MAGCAREQMSVRVPLICTMAYKPNFTTLSVSTKQLQATCSLYIHLHVLHVHVYCFQYLNIETAILLKLADFQYLGVSCKPMHM